MQKHRKVWQPLHWTDSHDKIRDLALNSKYTKQNYGRNNASTFYRGKHGSINLLCTYTTFLGISWMVGMQARLTYCTLFLPRHTPTHLVALMFMNHIFSCDQAALRTLLSVRLFVRPSVTPFSICSPHCIIMKLCYCHWQKWCPCKRSSSVIKGQGHRGQKPIYPFPDRNSSLNSHMKMKWCKKLYVA